MALSLPAGVRISAHLSPESEAILEAILREPNKTNLAGRLTALLRVWVQTSRSRRRVFA